MATDKVKLTKCQINLVGRYQFHSQDFLASFPGSLLKTREGESLVTSVGKIVDFWRLVLAEPIRREGGKGGEQGGEREEREGSKEERGRKRRGAKEQERSCQKLLLTCTRWS